MGSLKEKSISGIKWSAVDRFSSQGIQFVIGVIMARLLSPSDYGIIGMLAIFMALSQSFVDSGFSYALIRKNDCSDADFNTVFYFNVLIGVICYGVLFFLAPYISFFFKTPILKDVLRVLAINLIINSFAVVQNAKLSIRVDFKTMAKISVFASLISGVLGITLAYKGYGVWSLVYQNISMNLAIVMMLYSFSKWRPKLMWSKKSFKEMFSFGSKTLFSGLLQVVYDNLSTIVIGKFYTSKDLGFYSRGYQLASLPSLNISAILQRVTYPILSKVQNDKETLMRVYRKYICITSMIIFFMMTLLAVLSRPLVEILLTSKWIQCVVYTQIFCFSLMFSHISHINLNLLLSSGRSDLVLKLEVIKKTISTLILFVSIPFGVFYICASKLLYTQIGLFINIYYVGKNYKYGYREQLKDYIPYFLKSLISCFPAYLLVSFCRINNWLSLVIGFSLSLVLYYIILKEDKAFLELKSIVFRKK